MPLEVTVLVSVWIAVTVTSLRASYPVSGETVCAEVDGATSNQIFFKITLPLLRPILVYVMITSLIGGLQLFDVPQILTNGSGDPMRSSMTLIMYLNKHLYSKNYGMAGALSVMMFIITGILSLIVFRLTNAKEVK